MLLKLPMCQVLLGFVQIAKATLEKILCNILSSSSLNKLLCPTLKKISLLRSNFFFLQIGKGGHPRIFS
jgi:hypothetical protein